MITRSQSVGEIVSCKFDAHKRHTLLDTDVFIVFIGTDVLSLEKNIRQ